MKRFVIGLCVAGLVLAGAAPVFAGGAVNKNNLSVEYLRTLNRGAATDHADIVAYNPAGTTVLDEGFYLNVSAQHLMKEYTNTVAGTEYKTDEPSTIPELYAVYRSGPWSAFLGVNVPVGGGTVEYDKGNATTIGIGQGLIAAIGAPYNNILDQKLRAKSYGVGYTLGGAYRINDMFSIGAGLKYVDSESEAEGTIAINSTTVPAAPVQTAVVEYKYTGTGMGGVVSLDIFPMEGMTIGIKYDTPVNITYDTEVGSNTNALGNVVLGGQGIASGNEFRNDIPGFLTTAVSYQFTPKLRGEADLVYYFNQGSDLNGKEDVWDDGFDLGFCLEYAFADNFLASVGYLYTQTGVEPDNMTAEAPELDASTISGGIRWKITERFDLDAAVGYVTYFDDTTSSNVEYDKVVPWIGLGVQYKFF